MSRPKGCVFTEEHKRRISAALKGKPKSLEHRAKISSFVKTLIGEKAPNWKGSKVGYFGLHYWVNKTLGKPKKCVHCFTENPNKNYEWANKTGKYLRDITDWLRLCKSCHAKFDRVGYKSWIKRRLSGETKCIS